MEKAAETGKSKENKRWDSTKPGTIVAGPEAHAREGAGTTPSVQKDQPKGGAETNPADRSASSGTNKH